MLETTEDRSPNHTHASPHNSSVSQLSEPSNLPRGRPRGRGLKTRTTINKTGTTVLFGTMFLYVKPQKNIPRIKESCGMERLRMRSTDRLKHSYTAHAQYNKLTAGWECPGNMTSVLNDMCSLRGSRWRFMTIACWCAGVFLVTKLTPGSSRGRKRDRQTLPTTEH